MELSLPLSFTFSHLGVKSVFQNPGAHQANKTPSPLHVCLSSLSLQGDNSLLVLLPFGRTLPDFMQACLKPMVTASKRQ